MFCTNCGAQMEDGNAFCTNCGARVEPDASTPPSAGQPVASEAPSPVPVPAVTQNLYDPVPSAPTPEVDPFAPQQPAPAAPVADGQFYQQTEDFTPPIMPANPQPALIPVPERNNSKKGLIIGGIVAVVVIVAIIIGVLFATGTFGGGDAAQGGAQGGGQTGEQGGAAYETIMEPRSSMGQYSWEELSAISSEIAAAENETQILEIARAYNLATSDGRLDGSQVKDVELMDGTTAQVQLVGFAHDEKADGTGVAGLTFAFKDAIGTQPMNRENTNEGGWERSNIRSWLASSGIALLPEDLRGAIVEVQKKTNNVGLTDKADAVTVTNDKLWLFSFVELAGVVQDDEYTRIVPRDVGEKFGDKLRTALPIYNAEGSQYKLYADAGASPTSGCAVLSKLSGSDAILWWERTAFPLTNEQFARVNGSGCPNLLFNAGEENAVVPGFCI